MTEKSAIERIEERVDDIHELLRGPSSKPHEGLVVRVDRLEQSGKRASWFAGVGFTAAIGAAITTVWSKLIHL